MIRTAFALLALATLAKNDVSARFRLADACTAIVRAFTDNVSESHSQRFAPMVSVCPSRNALAMSELGRIFFAMSCGRHTVRKSASGHPTEQSDDAHHGSPESAPNTSESGGGVRRRVHAYISNLGRPRFPCLSSWR